MSTVIKELLQKLAFNSFEFSKIRKKLENSKMINLTGLTGSARSFFVSYLALAINRPILIVTPDITRALRYTLDIEQNTGIQTQFLPSQEASPYELVYSDSAVIKQQLNILSSFGSDDLKIVTTTAKNLLNTYLSKEERNKNTVKLKLNDSYDPTLLAKKLTDLGYIRTNLVVDPGEFSLRGDILDVYSISREPVRIEFFADEVENLRIFNTDDQRSIRHIEEIAIEPRYRVVIPEKKKNDLISVINSIYKKNRDNVAELYQETLDINVNNLISSIESETYFDGVEYLAPLLGEKLDDIFSYLPENTLIILHEPTEIEQKLHIQDEKYKKEYEKNIEEGLAIPLPEMLHREPVDIIQKLYGHTILNLESFIGSDYEDRYEIECTLVQKFLANLDNAANYISDLRSDGYNVVIVTEYPQRIESALREWECPFYTVGDESFNIDKLLASKEVIISRSGFADGFILPSLKLAVITDAELFNRKIKKPTIAKRMSKKENPDFLTSVNDLRPGDYVVHANHGIGKFIEFSKQSIENQEKDYLTIEYSNTDKLYMPADQINLLSRYRGSGTTAPKLSRMGGTEWFSVKSKVKKSITNIAQDLINLYAKRSKAEGHAFDSDTPWQLEMEDAFPYAETPDQLQAILDSKSDMESTKPMDRLICGDVGFGKTEVALRAVFKAILSGKQVAFLAPTTILAQQHYMTFTERFRPYPVRIELLSRFRTPKEQKETVKKLVMGDCDLVIGTHRLLQKDVEFKNPGLLIIDEEHRFGVAHKERLKQLRAEIDVLTLSATPIPRTLYMALSGVRDMSVINTPPVNRAPIKTYVGEYNNSMVRTAIAHELEREGQIFYVHNRIQSIHKVAQDLQKLVPDARIIVAHGQMNEKELEQIMYDFSTYQYDILVATTIIESGLDIPNANTIIINDADRFGLAQLYQLRGRVGRSETQAYSYCFYHPEKVLTKEARDRLKAIKDFTTLGSGYQIALRDLEIRGVGNILGSEQHGQMLAVGFDLYCSLLEESVLELQGQQVSKKEPPVVDINITAYIPDEWVGEKDQKMIEYKRLADVQSIRELELIEAEWQDRFGKLPDVVKRLIQIIRVRLIAAEIGINLVRETEINIRIFTDFNMIEWNKYRLKLPPEIVRKLKWTKAPVSSKNSESIILLNSTGLSGEKQLNMLEDLFYHISRIQCENS